MSEFWKDKSLAELSDAEWESLCDGCARCCMVKLQDEDTDEVVYTSIVCNLLDQERCRCTRYPERHELVADCVELSVSRVSEFHWLPKSCAYRTIAEEVGIWRGGTPWSAVIPRRFLLRALQCAVRSSRKLKFARAGTRYDRALGRNVRSLTAFGISNTKRSEH